MLSLQNFTALVQSMTAAAQGACSQLLDFTVGSVLRALTESVASVGLWLQWLIVLLMARQRLSTCVGVDVDSFVGDFGLTRLPGVASSGAATFSRFFATTPATLLVGETSIRTGDGSQTFTVIADTTNSYYSASVTDPSGNVVGGYIIPAGTASAAIPVQNAVVGTIGNVSANTITLLGSAIAGVDTVTNAVAFTNGLDAESDTALKARFVNYIGSLSKATLLAVMAAVNSVQQGITESIAENVDTMGGYLPGNFVVTIDDGTGHPSAGLISEVSTAVNQVRPLCVMYSVQGPTVTNVAVVLTLTVAAGYVKANLVGPVSTAIVAYLDTLPIGASLPYSKIPAIVYGVSPGITNVSAYTLNSGTSDITVGTSGVIKASPPPVIN